MTTTRTIGCLLAAVLAFGAGPALADTTLRLSEPMEPGSPEAMALAAFKANVETQSGGRLRIEVHLRDALAAARSPLEGLRTGTIDLYTGPLDTYRPIAPQEIGVLALPYLFASAEHLRRYLDSPTFERAERRLIESGIRFVSTDFNGVRGPDRVIVAIRPIRTPADLDGLRIRVNNDDLATRSWRSVGAVPVALGWNETYLALRRGVAEAAAVPLGRVRASHFAHVAPFVTATGDSPRVWPMAISERVWKGLSALDRAVLVEAANQAGRVYTGLAAEDAARDLGDAVMADNAVLAAIDPAPLRARMAPVWEELIVRGLLSRDVYDTVTALAP
ncbi:MAG: TRAP transporter substrate-binding protein [Rhodoplanes sp.]|uniref:TRAP transporter substrate-binding protein n=1 Tax=Rhodoplanes sp. TaxID=1968906 RepID=UPI0017D3C2BC|nr:TRAP transporter substrate-binding protein [Rhodoplanes sp.]NVO13643.1 TRAP transporter substrate-binding protein [Rhodoplanes sp.]